MMKSSDIYDVAVIGAGVTGASAARELSKYRLDTVVLEKNIEVSEGTTKANSAIVHAGYDCIPGTMKAQMNRIGPSLMEGLSKELDFPYKKTGSLVLAFSDEDEEQLEILLERGKLNGINGLEIISSQRVREMEPNVSEEVTSALYCSEAGIVCPYGMTYALLENAADNGVEIRTSFEVESIEKTGDLYILTSSEGEAIKARAVINAAGIFSDSIGKMVGDSDYKIVPRKGEYRLLDRTEGKMVNHVIFQVPSDLGKGVLVTPTVHGNLMIGPNSTEVSDGMDLRTTKEGLSYIDLASKKSVPDLNFKKTIRVFSGLRATPDTGDFMIYESRNNKGFIHAGGIESPGLASSPAIGIKLRELIFNTGLFSEEKKEDFNHKRCGITDFSELNDEEKEKLIEKNPSYGNIICRCETVTEGEIIETIRRNPGATTTDGVKRRVRAGMGRCQGTFCGPKVMEIISEELNIPLEEVKKDSSGGSIFMGKAKGLE